MPIVKRKHSQDDECSFPSPGLRLKAANTGTQVDVVRRTRMMLLFGQRLQAQKTKALGRKETKSPDTQCLRCKASYSSTTGPGCSHCAQPLCSACLFQCHGCNEGFCSACSICDYSSLETRSVCFECNR
ncbi:hypothetical protein GGF46_001339 [Coemansia sp. RSA 552]|nr:hypothetical protein GGF46_001339 [Coemansia sp. RSA 552]